MVTRKFLEKNNFQMKGTPIDWAIGAAYLTLENHKSNSPRSDFLSGATFSFPFFKNFTPAVSLPSQIVEEEEENSLSFFLIGFSFSQAVKKNEIHFCSVNDMLSGICCLACQAKASHLVSSLATYLPQDCLILRVSIVNK